MNTAIEHVGCANCEITEFSMGFGFKLCRCPKCGTNNDVWRYLGARPLMPGEKWTPICEGDVLWIAEREKRE